MQTGKMKRLLALTLALALTAPGHALGGVNQRTAVTEQEQGAPPLIQVIRRISVGGAYPTEETKTKSPKREAGKTRASSISVKSTPIRSTPTRSTVTRSTSTRSTSTRANTVRSAPRRA